MQSDRHKASVSELLLLRPVHTYLYIFLDVYWCTHIWFGVSLHFEEMLKLQSSLQPCRPQLCQTMLQEHHKMCLLQCHGESSVHDAAKPSHPMAGRALNAQLFVAELQFSLLPPSLCRTNWSKCRSCHMYNKAQSHWAENIQCFQKSLCALRG